MEKCQIINIIRKLIKNKKALRKRRREREDDLKKRKEEEDWTAEKTNQSKYYAKHTPQNVDSTFVVGTEGCSRLLTEE